MTSPEDRNKVTRDHMDVLLGDSLNVILESARGDYPHISEYQFQREVLGLLQDPFREANLQRYLPYVRELTNPLVVYSGTADNVLFTVPALIAMPGVSIPTRGGYTAENFLRALSRKAEMGVNINGEIAEFMTQITAFPDVYRDVLVKIGVILARYGKGFELMDEKGQVFKMNQTDTPTTAYAQPEGGSSFSGEYD